MTARRRIRRSRMMLRRASSDIKIELQVLTKRITAEHKAATESFNNGFEHAIKAGNLLIEAKTKIPHGAWAAWLKDHCKVGERMAQIYMRLAREVPNLDARKAKRVSDLSIRKAMTMVSSTTAIIKKLPPDVEMVFDAPDSKLVTTATRAQTYNGIRRRQAGVAQRSPLDDDLVGRRARQLADLDTAWARADTAVRQTFLRQITANCAAEWPVDD